MNRLLFLILISLPLSLLSQKKVVSRVIDEFTGDTTYFTDFIILKNISQGNSVEFVKDKNGVYLKYVESYVSIGNCLTPGTILYLKSGNEVIKIPYQGKVSCGVTGGNRIALIGYFLLDKTAIEFITGTVIQKIRLAGDGYEYNSDVKEESAFKMMNYLSTLIRSKQ